MSATIELLAAVPQFTVRDLVRTAEYYRDVLGFSIESYWNGESGSRTPEGVPVFAIFGAKCHSGVLQSRGG